MKTRTAIKLKAAFLLAVFTLNSVIGFACSLGVDMGFNSKHHAEDEALEPVVHIHKDGQKHIHYEKKEKQGHAHGDEGKKAKTHHDEAKKPHPTPAEKENCCSGQVKELTLEDKALPNALNIVHPIFATAFLASFYQVTLQPHTEIIKDMKQFVRSYHPPIPDIRIAIQSFQI